MVETVANCRACRAAKQAVRADLNPLSFIKRQEGAYAIDLIDVPGNPSLPSDLHLLVCMRVGSSYIYTLSTPSKSVLHLAAGLLSLMRRHSPQKLLRSTRDQY